MVVHVCKVVVCSFSDVAFEAVVVMMIVIFLLLAHIPIVVSVVSTGSLMIHILRMILKKIVSDVVAMVGSQ